METGMKRRAWLYAGTALASGAWNFLIVWTGRNRNCIIEDCTGAFLLWFAGLVVILVAVVALLRRGGKERFPTKPLALISLLFVGSGTLTLAVYLLVVDPDETLETVIGYTTIFALGLPAAFFLASAAWLVLVRRDAST
jgi:FtsH-binding integral membrane protein